VFIVDDSLYDRSRSKHVELLANVFDHCSMKYKRGFRMLSLGWSDGYSFIPAGHSLLSAADDKNLLCAAKKFDGRSLAGIRRKQSRRKATDVMVELIHCAQKAGIQAKYVLFDSWFSSPKTILSLKKDCNLDTIAMVKKSKTRYSYNDQKMNVKQIYASNRKRHGRSKYLLSVEILLEKEDESLPTRLVFVRNKMNRKDWLVLISTDMQMTEEDIIATYGKRWQILYEPCCYTHFISRNPL
jgi:predicted transcriptional regulator